MRPAGRAAIPILLAVWLVAVLGGGAWLWRYKSRAGQSGLVSASWPEDVRVAGLARATDRPTLLVFVHPECPCSRASLHELGRLLSAVGTRVAAHVIVLRPEGMPAGSERGSNWEIAKGLPGVGIHIDEDGVAAERFGVLTSGHTLLYDAGGRLRFSGGITASRGHEGDSAGRAQILALVLHGRDSGAPVATSSVFGCALRTARDARP
jgi:hypothetical protein